MARAGEEASALASTLGLSLKQVTDIGGALQLTTGSIDEAQQAMLRLAGVFSDVRAGQQTAIDQLKAVGVSLQDIARVGNDPQAMLELLADRWVTYADGAEKSARFTDIFGRAVGKIIPLLREGSNGIRRQIQDYNQLNPVAEEAKEKANELDTAFDRLGVAMQSIHDQVFVTVQPMLVSMAASMTAIATNTRQAIAAVNDLLAPLGGLARIGTVLQSTGLIGLISGAGKALSTGSIQPMLDAFSGKAFFDAVGLGANPMVLPPLNVQTDFGGGGDRLPRRGGGGGKGGGGGGVDSEVEEWKEAVATMKEIADEQAEAHRELDKLMEGSEDRFKETLRRTRLRFDDLKDAARDLGNVFENAFSNAFDSITEGTFRVQNAIAGLLKDLGKMLAHSAFKSITGRLFGGLMNWIGGDANGGQVDFGGGGDLIPGFAHGGSFRVGGSGGIDSQLAMMRLTPGELVEVTPPGQGGGGGEVIRLEINPNDAFIAGIADQQITTRSGTIVQVAVAQSTKAVQRNWSGMSNEANQRQI